MGTGFSEDFVESQVKFLNMRVLPEGKKKIALSIHTVIGSESPARSAEMMLNGNI